MTLLFVALCNTPDILDKRMVDKAKIYLSVQQSVLDIDGILTWQIEKQGYRFGARMVVKWLIIPIVHRGPISCFAHKLAAPVRI